ncbi:MAG: cupin domain-containing protein [Chloroflexi bacterium]|nr:cupin domain-containing protein [Chloroflexota bacterium]MDA1173009.1 cupin domain-containing protein [Chloroflexota bacterium]
MATGTEDREILRAKPSEEALQDFAVADPYLDWVTREGPRYIVDFAFEDLNALELGPWEAKGGSGAIINIPNNTIPNDAQVVEINPGAKSEPVHHMYETQIYVLSGRGATSLWIDENQKRTFEWHEGSLFSIPLNAWYQFFNASGTEAARYVAVTSAPPLMRLYRDDDFMFNNPHVFKGRFSSDGDMFSGNGQLYNKRIWESNFIPNAPDMPLQGWAARGAGGINTALEMAKNSINSHISEFPVGTYKKGHRHGPGAHLVLLSGDSGYSLMWTKEDRSDMVKANWKKNGMVIVPGDGTYHQHFNTGTKRARYLALKQGEHGLVPPYGGIRPGADVSQKDGGRQIEYEDEAREIHEIFEAELAAKGATCRMKAFIPYCTGEVGPIVQSDT